MPSNDPFAASANDGVEPSLRSDDGPLAFWNVYLGEVEVDGSDREIAASHRARVLEAFAEERLLGLVRPSLTNEWHGHVSGSLALAPDRRALVATDDGPQPGMDLRIITSRLATRLRATVSTFVDGMSEPWLATPLGPRPFRAVEERQQSMEAVASARLLVTMGDERAARSLRRELEARGTGAQIVEDAGRVGLAYTGEVELADLLRTRPLLALSVDDDRIELAVLGKRPLLSRWRPLWVMSWLTTDVGVLEASTSSLPEAALTSCLAVQRRTWTRPDTTLPAEVAQALGLDANAAARLQTLLDADRPHVSVASLTDALALPASFGRAFDEVIAGLRTP